MGTAGRLVFAALFSAAIAGDMLGKLGKFNKMIRLPTQFIGHHSGVGFNGADHRNTNTFALNHLNQSAEISIARKQNQMIHMLGHFNHIQRQFNIHVSLDFATTKRIRKFAGRFCDHGKTIIIQPVNKGLDGGIFLILNQRGVIKGANQTTPFREKRKQLLIINVKIQSLSRSVKVGPINEKTCFFRRVKYGHKKSFSLIFII